MLKLWMKALPTCLRTDKNYIIAVVGLDQQVNNLFSTKKVTEHLLSMISDLKPVHYVVSTANK
jgi:hypothetical protein